MIRSVSKLLAKPSTISGKVSDAPLNLGYHAGSLFSTHMPRKDLRKSFVINKSAKTSRHTFACFDVPARLPNFGAIHRPAGDLPSYLVGSVRGLGLKSFGMSFRIPRARSVEIIPMFLQPKPVTSGRFATSLSGTST